MPHIYSTLAGERLYPFSDEFHITDASLSATDDTSDLDSDLTQEAIPDDMESAGGANGSDESESNGGDIFSEGQSTNPILCLITRMTMTFLSMPMDVRCKMHPLCINPAILF